MPANGRRDLIRRLKVNCDLECVVRHSLETGMAANIGLTWSYSWELPYKIMFPHFLTSYSWSSLPISSDRLSKVSHNKTLSSNSTDVLSVTSK